jgi:hypothetical protein
MIAGTTTWGNKPPTCPTHMAHVKDRPFIGSDYRSLKIGHTTRRTDPSQAERLMFDSPAKPRHP